MKIKLYIISLMILIIILFNCCANSFMIPEISVHEPTEGEHEVLYPGEIHIGNIDIKSVPNDSLLIVY